MDGTVKIEAPRIHKWAKTVVRLDEMMKDPLFWVTQQKNHQESVAQVRYNLKLIFNICWKDVDIGYPNTTAIVNAWKIEGLDNTDRVVGNPSRYLDEVDVYLTCLELDMKAEIVNQRWVTPDTMEKELVLGERAEST